MNPAENFRKIQEKVWSIASSVSRNPEEILIISVSKTYGSDIMQQAVDSGIKIFGESRIQEAKIKKQQIKGDYSLHLIGHLQSNKARDAVAIFDIIHSIDKTSTAEKVNQEAEKINKVQKILIQVNTTEEETKSGIEPEEIYNLCEKILSFKNLFLLGLMTIGPVNGNKTETRNAFRKLKELLEGINKQYDTDLKELSMGMSSDYDTAIEEGATMLRIGSAIFGERDYSR